MLYTHRQVTSLRFVLCLSVPSKVKKNHSTTPQNVDKTSVSFLGLPICLLKLVKPISWSSLWRSNWSPVWWSNQWSSLWRSNQWSSLWRSNQWSSLWRSNQWSSVWRSNQWSSLLRSNQLSSMWRSNQWSSLWRSVKIKSVIFSVKICENQINGDSTQFKLVNYNHANAQYGTI